MAAIDRGIPWLDLREIDLARLVAETLEAYRHSAAEKGIQLTLKGSPARVRADRRQLARVISNLLSNAVKYMPGPGLIELCCVGSEAGVTLSVSDTGFGLDADELSRLFGKYSRLHRSLGIPGTGLGLYISRAIVAAHGGTITAESEPGRGSTFTVWLPRAPSRDAI